MEKTICMPLGTLLGLTIMCLGFGAALYFQGKSKGTKQARNMLEKMQDVLSKK